ncbi:hypothetical protein JRO89_XSUnG0260400 [Xanthoceras sorbifolium]|uniref:Uncharacterized protein n=1 Tax=Xanthoceras sorbifolium TaxID=99658 RepID=A0ABQ8GWL5_9ROSI|nr:hypothetical protein JRO89_XSUnG0260400 [Xanthoceras sorbifolium]
MPAIQSQPVQFSQPMQQFPPRPSQSVHSAMPSSQAIPAPYGQPNRPFTAGSPQSQHTAPAMNSHMPGLGAPGMPPSSSYTPQNHMNASSQFQPMPQMHAPVAGQPWMSSANHGASLVTPVQQTGQQVPVPSSTDTLSHGPVNL